MLSFEFTPEQIELRRLIRTMVRETADLPTQRDFDERAEFPYEHWDEMARRGLMAVCVPTEYGGYGGTVVDQTIVVDELGSTWLALGEAYVASTYAGVKTIEWHGSPEQKRDFLPRFASGEVRFAFGITEPDGGTDVLGAMKTYAKRDGSDYVINGAKVYTTLANVADYIVLVARTGFDPAKSTRGITLFLVPADAPGVSISNLETLGLKTTATTQCYFQDVRVPASAVIGEEGRGWYQVLASLNNERIIAAALALGNARAAFDYAGEFAKQRHAFGRPIARFQALQHYLVEMATMIETAHLLVYKAAALQTAGKPCGLEATMANMYASDIGIRVAQLGMSILAGAGYTRNLPMQRYLRDAYVFNFSAIANEMARNYIGEELGFGRSF